MATLYVRNIPADLYDDLRRWAAEHDRSVNAEVIDLLRSEADRRRGASDFAESLAGYYERWEGRFASGRPSSAELIREDRDRGHKPELGY